MPAMPDRFAISMIPLGAKPKISPSAIKADLAKTWPDLPPAGETEKKNKKDKHTVSFSLGDTHVILALMPGPIPWSDLEGPCATSVLWRDATEVLRDRLDFPAERYVPDLRDAFVVVLEVQAAPVLGPVEAADVPVEIGVLPASTPVGAHDVESSDLIALIPIVDARLRDQRPVR